MNIKKLTEEKEAKVTEMETLLKKVEKEERAFDDEESKLFDQLTRDVENIDKTMDAINKKRELVDDKEKEEKEQEKSEEERALEVEQRDIQDFASYIRNNVLNERATDTASNFSQGSNGVIIPTTIADKIITTAFNMSPILEKATRYNVKGNLEIPVYGKNGEDDITVGYGEDF